MKKTLLLFSMAFGIFFTTNAQTYLLSFEDMYQQITVGITATTEVATYVTVGAPKILLNKDRTSGIFTIVSPSTRTARMDTCTATFAGGYHTARIRLETNGASNSTNGRKIYIACPAAGKLTVGAWTATTARGYTLEDNAGTVLSTAASSMTAVTATLNLPVQQYDIAAAGTYVLNPNNGIYYGFVQFDVPTAVNQVLMDKGVSFNGTEILNKNGLSLEVFSVLGKRVAISTSTIPTANFQKGVYIVRVSGMNDSLKICI